MGADTQTVVSQALGICFQLTMLQNVKYNETVRSIKQDNITITSLSKRLVFK